ncbi:MAG: bifunctional phosphopantothenoylcysteine decarboxylase/phosphopantothenate--cysteine ligase CoaBC [Myxococcota bacterium]
MTSAVGLLEGTRVLLGVGGGIAAYKAPELVRRLRDAGADVQVMLTEAGARFVSPLSLEVVSEHPVGADLWRTDPNSRIVHTDVGQEMDLIVLAPATANLIARIRHGFADDLLTTTIMACRTPVLVCPSMNTDMLDNPLVRQNIDALEALDRYKMLIPDEGLLACGVTGRGRQPDPPVIIEAAAAVLSPHDLEGVRVTVSAGPTREALDPVRFVSNRSTGTMGFALARSFAARGAEVTLVAGPVDLRTPVGVARRVDVTSAADVGEAVDADWDDLDVLVMTAAVADYRPARAADRKIKKQEGPLTLELERTRDVLASTARMPGRDAKVLVGFAAETEDLEARAREKLRSKGVDWIVGNDVSGEGVGFGTGDNAGILVGRDGEALPIERADKRAFADRVVDHLAPGILARLGRGGDHG